MTKLILKDAEIGSEYAGDGLYEITLGCLLKNVTGAIESPRHLIVEIKSDDKSPNV